MIDWSKPVKTRDGSDFRLWTTEALCGQGMYPVRGEYWDRRISHWIPSSWTKEGIKFIGATSDTDLVNVPVKHKGFVNVYLDDGYKYRTGIYVHKSRDEALWSSGSGLVDCIEIEFEEGEGLK